MADATQAPATAGAPTQHTLNQADQLAGTYGYTREQQFEALRKLREPFDPSEIRYLPRVWCKACKDARGTCNRQDHERRQCRKCGQSMTTAHIDLRFVGHAEATNRLLNVDPFWSWEPLSLDPNGLPAYDGNRGLWIRLTVSGMTRLGYGNAEGKNGGDAVKEIIGDAIRNAGMRFGMALDLWTSSDLQIIENGADSAAETPQAATAQSSSRPAAVPAPKTTGDLTESPDAALDKLMAQTRDHWGNPLILAQVQGEAKAKNLATKQVQGPDGQWVKLADLLNGRRADLAAARNEQQGAA